MLCGLTERITIDPKHQLVVLIVNQAEFGGIGGVPKGILWKLYTSQYYQSVTTKTCIAVIQKSVTRISTSLN
jgi:hypothetical protein